MPWDDLGLRNIVLVCESVIKEAVVVMASGLVDLLISIKLFAILGLPSPRRGSPLSTKPPRCQNIKYKKLKL